MSAAPIDPSTCLTTKQVAAWLHRSEYTMRRWRSRKIGPPHFAIHGRVLYGMAQLREWFAEQQASRQGEAA
ncbi:helix-turn-helix domain-containing protein [Dyella agri]|uniref:Helix-turn-helix domain-containing protein n=1 Tax=Dyella agri TaxID=1926869 RepID=A0ABW8KAY5_9GAMM